MSTKNVEVKKVPREPILTKTRDEQRKAQATNFMKKIEGNKEAMQIFIESLKQEDTLDFNEMRLKQISRYQN